MEKADKSCKGIADLNNTINKVNGFNIYRTCGQLQQNRHFCFLETGTLTKMAGIRKGMEQVLVHFR